MNYAKKLDFEAKFPNLLTKTKRFYFIFLENYDILTKSN